MPDVSESEVFEGFTISAPPPLEEGATYPATVTGFKRVNFIDRETNEPKTLISWKFAVEVEGEAYELEGTTSTATGPMSKAYGWLVAILGAPAVKGGSYIGPAALIGRECLVTIGMDKNDFPRVAAVTSMPKGR